VIPSNNAKYNNIPRNYDRDWNHNEERLRTKWQQAITTEAEKMKHEVMRVVKHNKMESGQKCIICRWIFDISRYDTFKARLVACGYSQVPGVDFK
jgi:hypothetical protein